MQRGYRWRREGGRRKCKRGVTAGKRWGVNASELRGRDGHEEFAQPWLP